MNAIQFEKLRIDPVHSLYKFHTTVDVLRLDLLHPVVSGNKWFKLKGYLEEARRERKKTLVTFGGAFSNHIVAMAAAASFLNFRSVGLIRGERPQQLSPALQDASALGMKLFFLSRQTYRSRILPDEFLEQYDPSQTYLIPEGGYGPVGAEGAGDILKQVGTDTYEYIVAAVGTGTMLAGLTLAACPGQQVLGIPVLKNRDSLQKEIELLLPPGRQQGFSLLHDYHFGGYARHKPELIRFMNNWFVQAGIPSDFVYTGKLFYAVNDLVLTGFFPPGARILVIHSGGLQGNRSLPKGKLIF